MEFLDGLRKRGFRVWLDGGRLGVTPSYELTASEVAFIRQHKEEIVAVLATEADATVRDPFAGEVPERLIRTPAEWNEMLAALRYWTEYNAATTATSKPAKRRPQTETEELFQ